MSYSTQGWLDGQAGGTAITAARLNHMEQGIGDAHSLIVNLAPLGHTHTSAEIVDATELATPDTIVKRDANGRFAAVDGSAASDVTTKGQVDTALAGKADTVHTHTASQVADLPETVQDLVGGMVAPGTGVTLTYDDTAGTLTPALDTETVQDIVGAMVVEGAGVIVSYDDDIGTETIGLDPAYTITAAQMAASSVMYVVQNGDGTWPNRPTSRTNIKVFWIRVTSTGADPAPVTSPAVNGAYSNDVVIVGA